MEPVSYQEASLVSVVAPVRLTGTFLSLLRPLTNNLDGDNAESLTIKAGTACLFVMLLINSD